MTRLEQQINFILEIDKLKHILRKTRLIAETRHENSAEHSWHIALMALLLHEYSNEPIDLLRTVKMLLLHDIVEIDAGDTFAFGDQSQKAENEQRAAHRIFSLLPADQCAEFLDLWQEFEDRTTPESHYANAMDRLMPIFHNMSNQGGTWAEHGVTYQQALVRFTPIAQGSQALWEFVQKILAEAVTRGYFRNS